MTTDCASTRWFCLCLCVSVACLACLPVHASAQERIAEILVHGNFATPSEEIIAAAALKIGDPADDERLTVAERLLAGSGRFESVEVRRRYRSIANPDEILIILLVNERTGATETNPFPGPLTRLRSAGMFLPILQHRDGYGLTYGGLVSFPEALGPRARLSVPLTWGGERRAAVEAERTFERAAFAEAPAGQGPVTTIGGAVSLSRRENQHYREIDSRHELTLRGERALTPWLRAGADGRVSQITFGATEARHYAAGGHVTFDTRQDPSFPRNAVHATFGIGRLKAASTYDAASGYVGAGFSRPAITTTADMRGYIGVAGPVVLAVRGQLARANSPLPASEQPLIGGGETLRGYRAGHKAGDSMAAVSAELRVPLTSPIHVGRRVGVRAFVDAAAAWPSVQSIRTQQFDRGIGAGVFFGAAMVTGGFDVAWPERGKPRIHASLGVTF